MNTKDILEKMKQQRSNQNNNGNGNSIPMLKLQIGQKIKLKILRDSKTDKTVDPFKINVIHSQILPKSVQCNSYYDAPCPICDLNNDQEWNDMRWDEYKNGNRDLWKLMMKTQPKWVTSILVVPVNPIYKTDSNKEIHILYLWDNEVQDFAEQYLALTDEIKENINKVYFYFERFKTKAGYRLKIEPVSDKSETLSSDRKKTVKDELKDIPALEERIKIPENPMDDVQLYTNIVKPILKQLKSQEEFVSPDTFAKMMSIAERVFEPYTISEDEIQKEIQKEIKEAIPDTPPSAKKQNEDTVNTFTEDDLEDF